MPADFKRGSTVRKNGWIKPGLAAAVTAVAVIASLLAFASGGKAASPNVCTTSSTETTNASCVAELVSPHVLTANKDAVSVTSFTNQASGATATHVVVSVTFSPSVTVKAIKVLVNGIVVSSSCTPASLPVSTSLVSCPVGNISAGVKAKMVVRFSTATSVDLVGAASYGESGNDSSPPNETANDTQKARDSLVVAVGGAAQGNCFDAAQFFKGLVTVSGSTSDQSTTASVGQADSSLNLPCTPVSAGVDTNPSHRPPSFTEDVSFVEFMKLPGNAVGTVTIDFSSLLAGFTLKEFVGTDLTTVGTAANWTDVLPCSNLPPSYLPLSCIVSRKAGGTRYILNVRGSTVDPRYGG
jgi:archaellum component FlaF (FlaF/FlaG flagellin family)